MSKRRRILITLAGILLAAYITGPQARIGSGYEYWRDDAECVGLDTLLNQTKGPAQDVYGKAWVDCVRRHPGTYTGIEIRLTTPNAQLLFVGGGKVEGFTLGASR